MIVKPKELVFEVSALYEHGVATGMSTGWDNLDDYFTVNMGQFTTITGLPSHGKSEWLDALCVNLAKKNNALVCMFSPENHPVEMHAMKIMQKWAGRRFFGDNKMSFDDMLANLEEMSQCFAFIKPEEDQLTPIDIVNEAIDYFNTNAFNRPKILVIDPWNEMDHSRPKESGLSETEYISLVLSQLRKAAREIQCHIFLVAHPTKLRKDHNGNYPVPTPYDIAGSAHFYNKTDNAIAIYRDILHEPEKTMVHIQKVRFNTTGSVGVVSLYYDYNTTCYVSKETFWNSIGV